MAINDPVGDMLTRIRNAQMRRRGNVTTPGSRLRGRVLDVLKSEGFIRDYSTTEFGNGRTEFNIELKYFDGRGNFALGLKEHIVFPEISFDKVEQVWGMDIVICTTAKTDAEAKALLKHFNMPFTA